MRLTRYSYAWTVGLNLVMALYLAATARLPVPFIIVFSIAAFLALIPIVLITLRAKGLAAFDTGFVVGMAGTALLWTPLVLTSYKYVGPYPNFISLFADVSLFIGLGLLFASVFWPNRER